MFICFERRKGQRLFLLFFFFWIEITYDQCFCYTEALLYLTSNRTKKNKLRQSSSSHCETCSVIKIRHFVNNFVYFQRIYRVDISKSDMLWEIIVTSTIHSNNYYDALRNVNYALTLKGDWLKREIRKFCYKYIGAVSLLSYNFILLRKNVNTGRYTTSIRMCTQTL